LNERHYSRANKTINLCTACHVICLMKIFSWFFKKARDLMQKLITHSICLRAVCLATSTSTTTLATFAYSLLDLCNLDWPRRQSYICVWRFVFDSLRPPTFEYAIRMERFYIGTTRISLSHWVSIMWFLLVQRYLCLFW